MANLLLNGTNQLQVNQGPAINFHIYLGSDKGRNVVLQIS